MKYFIFIACVLFVSCSPARSLGNLLDKHPELISTKLDTIIETKFDTIIEVRDTTVNVPVHIPGETISVGVPYAVLQRIEDTAYVSTTFATARAYVRSDSVILELIQTDTVLDISVRLQGALRDITILSGFDCRNTQKRNDDSRTTFAND